MEVQRFAEHEVVVRVAVEALGHEIAIAGALPRKRVPELPRRGQVAVEQDLRLRVLHQHAVLRQAEAESGL